MRVLKFIVTGIIGISVNLGVFHALYVCGLPYLVGSVGGFLVAMIIGFALQKYWTFEDRSLERMHRQFAFYTAFALCNLAVNTFIVYLLVRYVRLYYLSAQAAGAGLVALASYFFYRFYIFTDGPQINEPIAQNLKPHF